MFEKYPKNLTGFKFGEWTVLEEAYRNEDGINWKCVCSCGVIKNVPRGNLVSGDSTSCGHNSKRDKLVDLKGEKFGELTVIEYNKENRKWLCKCNCGNTVYKRSWDLRNGKAKTCGCSVGKSKRRIDIVGKKFGYVVPTEYLGGSNYKCRCECGREVILPSYKIRTVPDVSCGCKLNQVKRTDITGKKIGHLEVIKYLGYGKYRCKCDCGNIEDFSTYYIKSKDEPMCSQCSKNKLQQLYDEKRINLYGKRFGSLEVIGYNQEVHKWKVRCDCGKEFEVYGQHLRRGDTRSCGCKYGLQNGTFRSYLEEEIVEYIRKIYKRNIVLNHRGILSDNKEIDIYLEDKRIGIEVDGTYWHSSEKVESKYHQNKVIEASKKGVRLIHIYEYEWRGKQEIIEKYIRNLICEEKQVIYARKTVIKKVDTNEEKTFLNKNHLQGYISSSESIGLYYNNELVGIMTFGKPRFNNRFDYELLRLAYSDNVALIGGAEKMFNQFIKEHNNCRIISYCNIDKFLGEVYERLGFRKKAITEPSYYWVNPKNNNVISRYRSQKYKLIELGLGTEEDTEDSIMRAYGYTKVYNSGNLVYEY